MTKDFNRFYLSKQMFLGATLLLASVGLATASPATGTTGTALPNPMLLLLLNKPNTLLME